MPPPRPGATWSRFASSPDRLDLPSEPRTTIWTEGFVYPNALVVLVGVRLAGEWSLKEAVDRAVQFRLADEVELTTPAGVARSRLRELGPSLLERGRVEQLGKNLEAGTRAEPFTLTTVIRGSGVNAQKPVVKGDPVNRALYGLATADRNWERVALPALVDHVVPSRTASPGHLVYAHSRSRVVWFPDHFQGTSGAVHALGCYHRNLALATATTENLGALVQATARQLADGARFDDLPLPQRDLSRRATSLLSQFYVGKNTYETRSTKVQIDDNNLKAAIDAMRTLFGMTPTPLT